MTSSKFTSLYVLMRHLHDFIVRPANILLSHKNIPVLVDFGFAEKYDMTSDTAFHSNLSYGTPEVSHYQKIIHLSHSILNILTYLVSFS